ncbi:hypothetical protein ES703_42130 [subsurface metagenome]
MSGSIGGTTFARNKYGAYARPRTKPVNPNTQGQQKARNSLSYLSEYWKESLSIAQRAAWNLYGSNVAMKNVLGETINLSGFNHFIRSNTNRLFNAQSIIDAGPTNFTLPQKDESLVISVDESPQEISVTWDDNRDWCDETFAFLHMRQGLPQNASRDFFGGPWRHVGIVHGSPIPWTPPWLVQPVMAVAVGQRQWCTFRISRADGRLSEPWSVSALVHAQAPGEVPMLIRLTQAEAVTRLEGASLVLGEVTTANHDSIPVDLIISSDPEYHVMLDPGSPVNIVVSLGPAA